MALPAEQEAAKDLGASLPFCGGTQRFHVLGCVDNDGILGEVWLLLCLQNPQANADRFAVLFFRERIINQSLSV